MGACDLQPGTGAGLGLVHLRPTAEVDQGASGERGRIPRSPEDNARTRWLRLHEIEAILAQCPEWLEVIVRFAVATGMRLGEVCSLSRAGYQVDQMNRAYVVTERTKNGERLIWPLEGWPKMHVEKRIAECRFPADYLFPGPEGGNARTSVNRKLPGAIRAAGLKYGRKDPDGVTFHSFRHYPEQSRAPDYPQSRPESAQSGMLGALRVLADSG